MIFLRSGDTLVINDDGGCSTESGKKILKFSKKFQEEIERLESNGYQPDKGIVSYMVYWKNKDEGVEYLIVLQEMVFSRAEDNGRSKEGFGSAVDHA